MRIAIAVLSVALLGSLALNVTLGGKLDREIEAVGSFASLSFSLANQVMCDALREKRIDIYTLSATGSSTHTVGEYGVRIVPLRLSEGRSTVGAEIFVGHNHDAVSALAAHLWEDERDVARTLMLIMSKSPHGTAHLVELIRQKGEEDKEVCDTISSRADHFAYLLRQYGSSPPAVPE